MDRKQLKNILERIMAELESSTERRAREADLPALLEASTILLFRTMFLVSLEEHDLLYPEGTDRVPTLTELCAGAAEGEGDEWPRILEKVKAARS